MHLMTEAYLNKIATAVPAHDVHSAFVNYVPSLLRSDRDRKMFRQLVQRSQIEHRFSFLTPHHDASRLDANDFYRPGKFPDTETRMRFYKEYAFSLACKALDQLDIPSFKDEITHLIITTCTGFYAPGIDLQIVSHYGLKASVERTVVGFMGCQAAVNALKLSRHIVRSDAAAKVIILNLELCTLHMQETDDLEQALSFLIFADGCSASVVSAQPAGIELQSFYSAVMPDSQEQITWHIGGLGFDMVLSRQVPATITVGMAACLPAILRGRPANDIRHWAIHPGGRGILDAVRTGACLPEQALESSRRVLRQFGNMSSATIMFVLKDMLERNPSSGQGCAISFGPGLTAESMLFQTA
jgi:alpha-pyrone synthase